MSGATKRSDYYGYLFLLPYLVLFIGFLIIPLGYGLILSLHRWEILSQVPARFVGLDNFREAISSEHFWMSFWATCRFVVMVVPSTVCFALLVAWGINAIPQKRQALYRASVFFPFLVSISVVGILWRWFYSNEFGLFNAWLETFGVQVPWITSKSLAMKSIAFMTLWWTVGGPMVILLAGLQQIPRHYYEAASIDGAGSFRKFIHITIPLLRPVLLFVVIMSIIGSFQVFGQTFMITRGGPENTTRVLVQYIYQTAFTHYRMGYAAAMSWLLFVVIAAFSFVQFIIMRED
jgi:multiple sugar transport system permease protein